jgi:hypothetical protein
MNQLRAAGVRSLGSAVNLYLPLVLHFRVSPIPEDYASDPF